MSDDRHTVRFVAGDATHSTPQSAAVTTNIMTTVHLRLVSHQNVIGTKLAPVFQVTYPLIACWRLEYMAVAKCECSPTVCRDHHRYSY